ncbi:PAS domain S-box-containing protein [Halopelagius inordinatus]|uniref:histidine kinase n=1 Tax=Halopelagius inordinatus TaxID=553467 RepID=A0A1I2QXU1_9EURY|nr:PAS domain S-box protein [Halopelagius inordinatus]SFG33194.1 PAS domain S-box-containing protein [Halopelagius inordinatus]
MSERADASDSAFWGDADDTEARKRYQTLVDAIDDGIYRLDAEATVVAVNDAVVELTGHPREELLGEHVSAVFGADGGAAIEREVDRLRENPAERSSPLGLTLRTADGERILCDVRTAALDADGAVGVVRERSESDGEARSRDRERNERERRLEESERRYRTLAEHFPNGLVTLFDRDLTYTLAAGRGFDEIPVDPEDVEGNRFDDVWDEATTEMLDPLFRGALDGDERSTELEYAGRDWVVHVVPLTDARGDVFGGMTVSQDITERKERERRLDETITELRESKEWLNLAFEAGNMGAWELDLRTNDAPVRSAQHDRIFGYEDPLEEWSFDIFIDHVHPADREDVRRSFEDASETGEWEFECRIVRADDGVRWVSARGEFYYDGDGDPVRAIGIVRDVTEQKEHERYLSDAKSQLEAAAEAGAVGTWEWHVPEDRLVADASLARKFGIDSEAAREGVSIDRLVSSVYDPDRERVRREIENAVESCGEYESEYRVRNADGDIRWVVARGHVECDDAGTAVQFPGALTDITERKEAQREIEESERRYRVLVENFPNGAVGLFDEEFRYTAVGGQLLEDVGISKRDRIGHSPFDIYPDERVEEIRPYFRAALDGEANSFETEIRGRHLFARTLPVRDADGEVNAGMIVVQDVTERREAERELRESEAKFRMMAENLDEIVWMATADREEFLYINPAFEEVWGIDRETLYDEPLAFLDAIHPDDRSRVREGFTALSETEFDEEFRVVRPDGETRWVYVRGTEVQAADGEITRTVGIGEDVTDRVERERELERSEHRYRTVVENFPNGAVALVDEDMRYVTIGGSPLTDSDLAAEDLVGRPVRELLSPPLADLLAPRYRAALRGESSTFEYAHESGDRHARYQTFPVRDDDGTIFGAMGMSQDITEQVEREAELERALELLERTERIADVGGWEIDPESTDVFWTDHTFSLLEAEGTEEPPLDEALDMYHEEDRQVVEDAVENALASGDPFDVEVRLRAAASGEVRWLRLHGVPQTVDGDVVSFRGAAQDITERKQREQRLEELIDKLEESNERLEQFAYAASHDLQEPLRMVSSYLQLVERRYADALDDDGREFIEYAVDGADRMRDMIAGLLRYSRVDTRGNPFEPVDLSTVIADVRDDLQVRIDESDAEIAVGELPRVDGDANQLRQLFQNLLDNAIEYSGDDRPRIDISAERDGDRWRISVEDEGIGVAPADTDRIFEVFQSLHAPDEHAGTGIGLALCERIVERHGGDIWVDSELGEGSVFSVSLPAADDREK